MKIVFGFSHAKSPYKLGSRIISIAEKREYSHVFIKYGDEVFQAAHGNVHALPYGEFLKDSVVVKTYTIEYTDAEFQKVLAFRNKMLGRPYSQVQIAVLTLLKLFGIKKNIMVDGTFSFICSELATYVASIHNIPVPTDKDTVTPSDFEEILNHAGYFEDKQIIDKQL